MKLLGMIFEFIQDISAIFSHRIKYGHWEDRRQVTDILAICKECNRSLDA